MLKTAKVYWSHLSSAKDLVILAMLAMATLGFFMVSQAGSAQGARDCDGNAILYCGAYSINELKNKYDGADAAARGAFNHFGVQRGDFDNLVEGYVTRDNRVVVNGRTVASNVKTAGKHHMPGSTQISGGAYVRPPSVSFRQNSLDAYVMMQGDRFLYAIIKSCGNPAGNGVVERGSVSLTQGKTTAPAAGSTVETGDTVHYQMTVKNSGSITAHTVSIADAIPAGTTYVQNSFETVGSTPAPDLFDFDGNRILAAWHQVPAGEERTIKFRVTINDGVTPGHDICNLATTDAEEVEPQQTNQVCHEVDEPDDVQVCNPETGEIITVPADEADDYVPVDDEACQDATIACGVLSAGPRSGQSPLLVDFAVSVTGDDGVEVESFVFDFDENGTEVVEANRNTATVRETFETGTYTVRVTEIRTDDGTVQVPRNQCVVTITVTDEEPEVAYECVDLVATPRNGVSPLEVDFTARSSASGGAQAVRYNFDYDNDGDIDDTGRVTNGASSIRGAHTYTGADEYTAKVYVEFELPDGSTDTVSSRDCEEVITVTEEVEPQVEFACVDLVAAPAAGQSPLEVTLTATASATNTDIVGYAFDLNGDGSFTESEVVRTSATTASIDHTFTENETVRVIVVTEDGQTEFTNDCSADITVEQPDQETLICSGLSMENIDRDTKKFTISTSGEADLAENGYQFEVDGQALERQSSNMLTRDFSDGDHTVRARVIYDGGNSSFADCVVDFKVSPSPENPPELPDTGSAGMLSAVFGTTTLGQGMRIWLSSRKKLLGVLLGA